MTIIDQSPLTAWTRRQVLGSLAFSFAAFRRQSAPERTANLYVHPGSSAGTTLLAVQLPPLDLQQCMEVRIHARQNRWNLSRCLDPHALTHLGIEVASDVFPVSGAAGIWAEYVSASGRRKRIASPFLARLLSEDKSLAKRYHDIQPSEDRAELTDSVIAGIASIIQASGTRSDPEPYARRLAGILLPDLLYYDPLQPVGFTFAAQNGRLPKDPSIALVRAVLTGNLEG